MGNRSGVMGRARVRECHRKQKLGGKGNTWVRVRTDVIVKRHQV